MRWRPVLFAAGLCAGRPVGAQVAPATTTTHALERPVPLDAVRMTAAHLRRRVVGNSSDSRRTFFWPDYNTSGNQVGQRLALRRPGWLEAVSFRVAACSYDSLFLRVRVYGVAQGFPGAALLPPVAVRLARADLANRVVLDLRPYHVWLGGDAVVALEILRAQGPGTLAFSAAMGPGGTSYEIDLPGDGTNRNIPPRGASQRPVPWQLSPSGPWHKTNRFSIGIDATILQESR